MRRQLSILLLLLACPTLWAQEAPSERFQVHLSTGTSVASGFGQTQGLMWVAPSIEFHPDSRLTVKAGFASAGSLLPVDYVLQGHKPRDLAPVRQGTRIGALWAAAEYKLSDRFRLWGSIAHLNGFAQPLWLDHSLPLQATAFSGGFGYQFTENSLLEVHFHVVRDNYGTAFPSPLYNPYYGTLGHGMTMTGGPWAF